MKVQACRAGQHSCDTSTSKQRAYLHLQGRQSRSCSTWPGHSHSSADQGALWHLPTPQSVPAAKQCTAMKRSKPLMHHPDDQLHTPVKSHVLSSSHAPVSCRSIAAKHCMPQAAHSTDHHEQCMHTYIHRACTMQCAYISFVVDSLRGLVRRYCVLPVLCNWEG